jgi:hypothetical protein
MRLKILKIIMVGGNILPSYWVYRGGGYVDLAFSQD